MNTKEFNSDKKTTSTKNIGESLKCLTVATKKNIPVKKIDMGIVKAIDSDLTKSFEFAIGRSLKETFNPPPLTVNASELLIIKEAINQIEAHSINELEALKINEENKRQIAFSKAEDRFEINKGLIKENEELKR